MGILVGAFVWLALLVELFDRITGKNQTPTSKTDDDLYI